MADEELRSLPNDNVSAELKSYYVILLKKSLAAFELTLDRLRSPQNAGKHPLHLELEQHFQEVENCLTREDINFLSSKFEYEPYVPFAVAANFVQRINIVISFCYVATNRNTHDGILDDSFSSNRFEDSIQNSSRFVNISMQPAMLSNLSRVNGQGLTSTPCKSKRNLDATENFDASQLPRQVGRLFVCSLGVCNCCIICFKMDLVLGGTSQS